MANYTPEYRVFLLTWPAFCANLHRKRVQLPKDWFGTPTLPPFYCFGTPIWPLWRHVKTLYNLTGDTMNMTDLNFCNPWWTCPLIEFRRLNSS